LKLSYRVRCSSNLRFYRCHGKENNSFVLNPPAEQEENKRIKHTFSRDNEKEVLICPGTICFPLDYFPFLSSKQAYVLDWISS
jgi:hypothetical protein